MKLSLAIFPDQLNQSSEVVVAMNVPVLCFAVGITLIAGVLFRVRSWLTGIAPELIRNTETRDHARSEAATTPLFSPSS